MGINVEAERVPRITTRIVEKLAKERRAGVRLVVRDDSMPGLALIVSPQTQTWRYDWRPRGVHPDTGKRWPMQSLTIGTVANFSPDAARAEAAKLKGHQKQGTDIGAARRAKIAETVRKRAASVSALLSIYKAELPDRPKLRGTGVMGTASAKAEIAHAEAAVESMGVSDNAIADVSVADLARLLAYRARQPATARKHWGAVSRFFEWVVERGDIQINPCLRMPKARRPRQVPSRPVCPSLADLARIWAAAGALAPVERDLVRWLILTPSRLREATCLDWRHVNWRDQRIELPGSMMKTGAPHAIPVPAFTLDFLQTRYALAGKPKVGLVFPSVRKGNAIESTTKMKATLATKSGVTGWTFHDFRRSFASAAAELGVPEPVADAILSHRQSSTRGGVLGVYQKSVRWPEQVTAMNAWCAALSAALSEFSANGALTQR